MGLFDRIRKTAAAEPDASTRTTDPGGPLDPDPLDELPLSPQSRRIGEDDRQRITAGLQTLEREGIDVDDLSSLGAGLDRELIAWQSEHGDDHDAIVERYAIGIGEHLHRHTDLSWEIVTDVFGTDLAVAAGEFVVVPGNLVAARWMRRETGWLPKVVGHLVTLRTRGRR